MNRAALDDLSLAEIHELMKRHNLTPSYDRDSCIDVLMDIPADAQNNQQNHEPSICEDGSRHVLPSTSDPVHDASQSDHSMSSVHPSTVSRLIELNPQGVEEASSRMNESGQSNSFQARGHLSSGSSVDHLCLLMMEQFNIQRKQMDQHRADMFQLINTLANNQGRSGHVYPTGSTFLPSLQASDRNFTPAQYQYPVSSRVVDGCQSYTPSFQLNSQPLVCQSVPTPLPSSQIHQSLQGRTSTLTPSLQFTSAEPFGAPPILTPLYQEPGNANPSRSTRGTASDSSSDIGNPVKFLTNYIPTFGGSEEENIRLWIEKIENSAEVHGLSQATMLTAAISMLTKTARRWLDLQSSVVNRSWPTFKEMIFKRFYKRPQAGMIIRKAQARKWNMGSETFMDYATEKQAILHCLEFPESDVIYYLIEGIEDMAIKAIANSLESVSMDTFLDKMRSTTASCSIPHRKQAFANSRPDKVKGSYNNLDKNPEGVPSSTGTIRKPSSPHSPKKDLKDMECHYCHALGHVRSSCYKLKKKNADHQSSTELSTAVAMVEEDSTSDTNINDLVAFVSRETVEPVDSIVIVNSLNDVSCKLTALWDTGSSISLIQSTAYDHFFPANLANKIHKSYACANDDLMNIKGVVPTPIELDLLPNMKWNVDLHIMNSRTVPADLILGRDFYNNNNIM
ncbi:hypothetical protein RF55_14922 [Lasius niger]|uniref:Retrotransposon gag domain-containing protein n=1 Tax=Lasius niger TaxID=67767 RepID=A0A0J7K732_LASNI|nr:hypothetical protein RF55_14922 [Lasius niger]